MKERLEYLDALRGFAALLVVAQHVMQRINDHHPSWVFLVIENFNYGRFGVMLFFLISGFVVPFSFSGPTPIRGFAISRAFRIYPALWLSVFFAAAIIHETPPDASTLALNFAGMAWLVGTDVLLGVYWTLTYEILFYCACAGLYAVGALHRPHVLAPLILVAIIAGAQLGWGMPVFVAFLFLGTLIRLAVLEGDKNARILAPMLSVALVLGCAALVMKDSGNIYLGPAAIGLSMSLAVVVFWFVVLVKPPVSERLTYLGAISYSVYLFHAVPLILGKPLLAWSDLLYAAVVFGGTLGLAALIYRYVEQPSIDLGRMLRRRSGQPEPG